MHIRYYVSNRSLFMQIMENEICVYFVMAVSEILSRQVSVDDNEVHERNRLTWESNINYRTGVIQH